MPATERAPATRSCARPFARRVSISASCFSSPFWSSSSFWSRRGSSSGGIRRRSAAWRRACSSWPTCARAAVPVTASRRRTPDATAPSVVTLNSPIWPVASRCVPPQSSVEKSPIRMTRTWLPYFSPKSAIAPILSAASRSVQNGSTVMFSRTASLTRSSTCSRSRSFTGLVCVKSKRSRSGATSEPACVTWVPRTFRSAAWRRCVPVWWSRRPWRRGDSTEAATSSPSRKPPSTTRRRCAIRPAPRYCVSTTSPRPCRPVMTPVSPI